MLGSDFFYLGIIGIFAAAVQTLFYAISIGTCKRLI